MILEELVKHVEQIMLDQSFDYQLIEVVLCMTQKKQTLYGLYISLLSLIKGRMDVFYSVCSLLGFTLIINCKIPKRGTEIFNYKLGFHYNTTYTD